MTTASAVLKGPLVLLSPDPIGPGVGADEASTVYTWSSLGIGVFMATHITVSGLGVHSPDTH